MRGEDRRKEEEAFRGRGEEVSCEWRGRKEEEDGGWLRCRDAGKGELRFPTQHD